MIRNMCIEDLQTVIEIENLCFTSRWTEDMFLYEMNKNEFGSFFVYEDEGKVIGFIDFWITFETCQLANLAIHPAHQGKGYAKALMDCMVKNANLAQCENIILEVRVSNDAARHVYEAYDFIEMSVRKGYYSDNGEDAIVMCKALGGNCA